MMRASLLTAAVISLATITSSAQAPDAGTARIIGIVMTTDGSPAPVRRAVVTLKGEGAVTLTQISNDSGRFDFTNVPAGRYLLTASRPGFLTATYGARGPGRPGHQLSVGAGETHVDVTLNMGRGAAISGTVRDARGRPAPNVEVLVRPAASDIEARLPIRSNDAILTDDRGMYRAFGLAPGSYVVVALPQLTYGPAELHAMTPAEIDAALRSLQTPQKPGTPPAAADTRSSPRRMYVPVFHPQTTSQSDAATIKAGAGDDIGGIDVTLMLVSAVNIEGQVLRPDGASLAGTQVIISGAGSRMPITFASAPVQAVRPGPDGRFKYSNVAPGTYVVTARTQDRLLFATAQVTAGADDIRGLTLAMQPALTFGGSVRIDASASAQPRLSGLPIALQPPGGRGGGIGVMNNTSIGLRPSASGAIAADGTFEITGVLPGTYGVSLTPPTGWRLRSVMVDGRDMLDEVMTLDRSVPGAVVTLTDRPTELSGSIQPQAGRPAAEFDVLVFSVESKHWFKGSRRTKTARPDSDGRYAIKDLPAGDYWIAAIEDADPAYLADPRFLEQVTRAAIRTTIADGERKRLDLKVR